MGLLYKIKSIFSTEKTPTATRYYGGGTSTVIAVERYDGEIEHGEMGPPKDYIVDHTALAARSKQAYLDNDLCRAVVDKFAKWVIGNGLKVQPEPFVSVLEREGISDITIDGFSKEIQPYFQIFAKSKTADWSRENNLHQLAYLATINALLAGDCLVVGRLTEGRLSFQLIDGQNITTPIGYTTKVGTKGNRIKDGVEINSKGEHVAYHVRVEDHSVGTKRIPAYGKQSGMRMAWLYTGVKYRLKDVRGIPILSSTLQTMEKLNKYRDATVGAAEEQNKIIYQVVHDKESSEESVFGGNMMKALNKNAGDQDVSQSDDGQNLTNTIFATTDKQAIDNPKGAKIEPLQKSSMESEFGQFWDKNLQIFCAGVDMPYEVALEIFNSNFSASRAALKAWEHTKNVWAEHAGQEFYQPCYNLFFTVKVLENKIQAPGYLQAFLNNDWEILESYRNVRYIGKNVPHIDPVKEVKAKREALGKNGDNIPLTTVAEATESLNEGDAETNMIKFGEEKRQAEEAGIDLNKGDSSQRSFEGDGNQNNSE